MLKNVFAFLLTSFLLVACGAGGTPTPRPPVLPPSALTPQATSPTPPRSTSPAFGTPAPAPTLPLTPAGIAKGCCPLLDTALPGQIVYSNGEGDVWVTEVKPGAQSKKVVSPPGNKGLLYEPAWSPDGKQIIYSFLRPFDSTGLATQEVLTVNADGSDAKTLLGPQISGEVFKDAAYSPDGRLVFFAHAKPIFNDRKQVISATLKLERYDIQTRQFKFIADDGTQPDVSPDGKRIVFIKTNPETLEQNLWVSTINGEDAEPVLDKKFAFLVHSPRWSKDSQRILFSVPNLFAKRQTAPTDLLAWVQSWFSVRVAEAHGAPMDFWIVDFTGKNLQRLTEIGEDEPYAAWSPDGAKFAFLGLGGMYIVDADGKNARWLFRNGGRGRIDWKK